MFMLKPYSGRKDNKMGICVNYVVMTEFNIVFPLLLSCHL
jgi:hypothetical protein